MFKSYRRELGLIVAWLLFPLVPVVLEDIYYSVSNLTPGRAGSPGPDPHDWGWLIWIIILGPLLGYGFLAGATLRLPDDPARPRRWYRKLAGPTGSLGGDRTVVGRARVYRACSSVLSYAEQLFPGLAFSWHPSSRVVEAEHGPPGPSYGSFAPCWS